MVYTCNVTGTLPIFSRDQLKRHYNLGQYWIQIDIDDLSSFDSKLADKLIRLPAEYLPLVTSIV